MRDLHRRLLFRTPPKIAGDLFPFAEWVMRRFTTVLIWLANRGSRFYWLWHFGPFKWWLVSVRDPLKHASRR